MNFRQLYNTAIMVRDLLEGQEDKSGLPMSAHAFRVSQFVQRFTDDPDAPIVALLHDIIEDTPLMTDDLRQMGYSERVIEAVQLLTHFPEFESYEQYVRQIADSGNTLAIAVKLADNLDNASEWRHAGLDPDYSAALMRRYRMARDILLGIPSAA